MYAHVCLYVYSCPELCWGGNFILDGLSSILYILSLIIIGNYLFKNMYIDLYGIQRLYLYGMKLDKER